jgi:hypothetical protein
MRRVDSSSSSLAIGLAWTQGMYFLITGVWPIVSVETFEIVTGKKTDHLVTGREGDHWMLNTISALIIAIALVLLSAAWRKRITIDAALLAVASGLALTVIDVVYVTRGTIRPIYLLDAAVEVVLIVLWAWVFFWQWTVQRT